MGSLQVENQNSEKFDQRGFEQQKKLLVLETGNNHTRGRLEILDLNMKATLTHNLKD